MVLQKKKFLGIPFSYKWFSEQPKSNIFTVYRQSADVKKSLWIKKQTFHTKLIDLTQSIETIKSKFAKNTKYKIRRAATKDDLEISCTTDLEKAIIFHNLFAVSKKIATISLNQLQFYTPENLLITKVWSPFYQDLIAMHFYVVDEEQKRVRLLYSATTTVDLDDSLKRSFIGRVNRYLHFKDMLLFKERGFLTYDLGGYAVDTKDAALLGINRFKDNFGGELVKENDYYPIWLYWIIKWKSR